MACCRRCRKYHPGISCAEYEEIAADAEYDRRKDDELERRESAPVRGNEEEEPVME